jgi:hypothetical protein
MLKHIFYLNVHRLPELRIIFNLLLQQFVSDSAVTWETHFTAGF